MIGCLDIVAYRYEGEKYCPQCFLELTGNQTIRFSPIYRAVQVQSCIKNCYKCNKDLINGQDQIRNQQR